MAIPKVFVSSTCFDLGEVRDQLKKLIESFGFDPILSEYGDVFYHPDLHTHEACIQEVSNCQLFILIIGGRFGGEYTADKEKSITNAEYNAAKESNIPVFTYVRKNVLANQLFYKENKAKPFVSEIDYPSIEKQEYALNIFKFIDDVRKQDANNAVEGFENFQEIECHLRKQWAGMFFDFLKTREVKSQIDATNHLLSGLSHSSNKLEELIKSLYISVDKEAEKSIKILETRNQVEYWYMNILALDTDYFLTQLTIDKEKIDIDKVTKVLPKNLAWHEYLVKTGLYQVEHDDIGLSEIIPTFFKEDDTYSYDIEDDQEDFELLESYTEGILNSNQKLRKDILTKIIKDYSKRENRKS